MSDLSAPEKAKLAAMMFQNPDLQFCMDTPFHELVFCLENLRTEPDEIRERAEAALEFCGISDLRDRKFVTLSGGVMNHSRISMTIRRQRSYRSLFACTGREAQASWRLTTGWTTGPVPQISSALWRTAAFRNPLP